MPRPTSPLAVALDAGLSKVGLTVSDVEWAAYLAYLELLERWNRKVNLTAFDLAHPVPAAIDRLVIEPLVAADLVRESDRVALDIGSGGGSPAIPLAIRCRRLTVRMVEMRQRKAAFLREAVRSLGLAASVDSLRFEELAQRLPPSSVDIVTVRAVRPGAGLVAGIERVLAANGLVIFFGLVQTTDTTFDWRLHDERGFRFSLGSLR